MIPILASSIARHRLLITSIPPSQFLASLRSRFRLVYWHDSRAA